MRNTLYHLERDVSATLQSQIRQILVSAIFSGQLAPGDPIPSTRAMARQLSVSRNTVTIAYQHLVADGFLHARQRSGFYVDETALDGAVSFSNLPSIQSEETSIDWNKRLSLHPSQQQNILKPFDWRSYEFPFIYGQVDADIFPIAEWRDCVRQAMGKRWLDAWTEDRYAADDPLLIEQIKRCILPRRGIAANDDQILITLGAQNALYLIAHLLVSPTTYVAMEEPGYTDMRNIFSTLTHHLQAVPIDAEGITISPALSSSSIVYTTPSHQYPTTVTMSLARRKALLSCAAHHDMVVIEDDYECETNYSDTVYPALKSLDTEGRVIYVGTLSKLLMPGLRLGFIVANSVLIKELRALRRLILRHPPGNNQRTSALFLANGHYDTLVRRMHRVYRQRWETLGQALEHFLPGWSQIPSFGGSSYWLSGPDTLDSEELFHACLKDNVVIEPGSVYFAQKPTPKHHFRLGYSSIATEKIEPGIMRLRHTLERIT